MAFSRQCCGHTFKGTPSLNGRATAVLCDLCHACFIRALREHDPISSREFCKNASGSFAIGAPLVVSPLNRPVTAAVFPSLLELSRSSLGVLLEGFGELR
ncbi:hypothetical protein CRG98_002464 [Punica granatum]|uniref:Uncharacterized protein n=1 Tax=Punica granatum TaxID=22663 RepID=A0A2I0L8D9_PUNGR|nr:hypothetical protein CRG98_002464 [Punica granatum]